MPSFLSRIRRGSSTHHSTHSASSPPAPTSLGTTPNLEEPSDISPSPLIGLKIQPDLDSLLESHEKENISPKHQDKGLVTASPSPIEDSYNHLPLKPHGSRNAPTKSPELMSSITPGPTGPPAFPIFAEDSPLSGTFGRQQSTLANPRTVGPRSSHRKAPTRSRSFGDAANADQTLTSAQGLVWNPTPTNQFPLSGTFEGSHSVHSLPNKRRRIDRRRGANTRSLSSLRTNRSSSPATPHQDQTSPPVVCHFRSESPRTFGYPTPTHSTHTFGHHESPPPPLPPLDHPELTLDGRDLRSVTFCRSHKPSNSVITIPCVDEIFGIPQELTSGTSVSRKYVAGKHSKTLSVDSKRSSRRSSAEWSSVQATEGVLTNSTSWQAQVSREILRLSFGEPVALPAGDPGNNRDFSHVSATRHPPTDAPVSQRPPPSLGSPLFFQGKTERFVYKGYRAAKRIHTVFRFEFYLFPFRILWR